MQENWAWSLLHHGAHGETISWSTCNPITRKYVDLWDEPSACSSLREDKARRNLAVAMETFCPVLALDA